MRTFDKLDTWADDHHHRLIDVLRIMLGVIILYKGIFFISHPGEIANMLMNSSFPWASFAISHIVAFAHLVGGTMIIFGLYTRLAVSFQIPILVGAVVFVNAPMGFFVQNSNLELSLIVLALLVFFFVYGSGFWSVDYYWRNEERQAKKEGVQSTQQFI